MYFQHTNRKPLTRRTIKLPIAKLQIDRLGRYSRLNQKNQHFISETFSIPIESPWRDKQLSCLSSSFKSKSRLKRSSSAPLTYSKPKKPCQYCGVEYIGLKNHENKCHKKPNKTVKTNSSSHNLSYFAIFFSSFFKALVIILIFNISVILSSL